MHQNVGACACKCSQDAQSESLRGACAKRTWPRLITVSSSADGIEAAPWGRGWSGPQPSRTSMICCRPVMSADFPAKLVAILARCCGARAIVQWISFAFGLGEPDSDGPSQLKSVIQLAALLFTQLTS